MTETQANINSIRQALAGGYKRPDPALVEQYIENLKGVPLDYLKVTRGLTDETIRNFKLGYDQGRNAISIPVYKQGELVNIRYRSLDPDAKAKYTQERGCEVWLYNEDGIERGKAKKGVLVVEGEFDLMMTWQAGFKNVVSPASGKDSYGVWIELLDAIPRVYIAYDNDKPGKKASLDLSERVGIDKCWEVLYPEGVKDANEYFLKHTSEEFRALLQQAQPYYKHKYSGIGDILDGLRERPEERLELDIVPYVKWKSNWLAVLTADSGGGKTTYALNIADELINRGIPTLFLPFERGIKEVGERFLQVRYDKQEEDLATLSDEEFKRLKEDAVEQPLYFSMPKKEEFMETVKRAKRIFNTKFVIVDHLDYFVRGKDRYSEQADWIHKFKEICIELDVMMLVVHHIHKPENGRTRKKLVKEDLKGSSDLYQIPEVVILMYPDESGSIIIDVDKNKGPEGRRVSLVDMRTGKFNLFSKGDSDTLLRLENKGDQEWNDF